jgi:hypothetical protein
MRHPRTALALSLSRPCSGNFLGLVPVRLWCRTPRCMWDGKRPGDTQAVGARFHLIY